MDAHQNFARSTVATAPSPASSGTSLVVAAGDGALFPVPPFNATVWPSGSQPTVANAEIVRVTSIVSDTFTITRTEESTSARTIVVGDQIAATITKKTLTDIEGATVPTSPSDATKFLNGAATPAFALVKDSDLSTSDITTNNVSTTKHGFTPKLPNDATKYLDGTGAYSVPTGSGGWTAATATAATGITISSLDLNANKAYVFLIETTDFGAMEGLACRVNNDSTGDSSYANVGIDDTGGSPVGTGGTGATGQPLCVVTNARVWVGEIRVFLARDGRPSITCHMTGTYTAAGTGGCATVSGSAHKNATTNMTSIRFYSLNSNSADWRVYYQKTT